MKKCRPTHIEYHRRALRCAALAALVAALGCGAAPRTRAPADRDGDGIADADDRCPDEPETRNGVLDDDGCPNTVHPGDLCATFIVTPIAVGEGEGELDEAARAQVDALAEQIRGNPDLTRFAIVGHAGAGLVRDALVARGVEPSRLQTHEHPGAPKEGLEVHVVETAGEGPVAEWDGSRIRPVGPACR